MNAFERRARAMDKKLNTVREPESPRARAIRRRDNGTVTTRTWTSSTPPRNCST